MQSYLPLSDQLNLLFETRLHPDERPYTLQEVSEQTGVSLGTISQIRGGRILKSSVEHPAGVMPIFPRTTAIL